jgi:nitrite reductase/ring-hydroxylating ferredoxin subunit
VRRFVEDLLAQRRTHRGDVDPAEDAELRAAITLRAADPDAAAPRPEFLADLHDRLRQAQDDPATSAGRPGVPSRRRFVQVAASAAVGVGVGVGVGVVVGQGEQAAQGPSDRELKPSAGEWRAVAASKDLPDGGVRPFDLGTVAGFVSREGDVLRAVSGVCTHLGCKLKLDTPARQLNCPCHRAAFGVQGQVLRHELPIELPPLPQLQVRVSDGVIQVFAPADA